MAEEEDDLGRMGRAVSGSQAGRSGVPRPLTRIGLEANRLRHARAELGLRVRLALGRGIDHLYGPADVSLGPEELVVLCVVRNGAPWLPSYLRHYRQLGAAHLVFLDNGSEDETLSILTSTDDVSVFTTRLPFGRYSVALKRWLVRRFGGRGWRLCCDVDELFEHPCSEALPLRDFLAYLNRHGFNAVTAQMLDMFSAEPLDRIQGRNDIDLKASYPLYDLADVVKTRRKYWLWMNRLGPEPVAFHRGGIRARIFGLDGVMLTKQPLMRPVRGLNVFPYDEHFVTGADLADVTGLIRHYTLTSALARQVRDYTDPKSSFHVQGNYRRYGESLGRGEALSLRTDTSREYEGTRELLNAGFLVASPRYLEEALGGRDGRDTQEVHGPR